MKDCVFCQIVKGELPCYKIYEDDQFLAFLDIAPFTEGHTQVIPKKHYRWVWDMPNADEFFSVVQKITNHFRKVSGENWVCSIVWGQLVAHAHIQVLPWPKNLDLEWSRDKLTKTKAKQLLQKLVLS